MTIDYQQIKHMDIGTRNNSLIRLAAHHIMGKIEEHKILIDLFKQKPDREETVGKLTAELKRMEDAVNLMLEFDGCW